MTGMLDPVGPEDPRTYWVRRGVVGAAVLIIVVLVIVAVTSLNGGGATQGTPTVPSGPSLQPASSTPQSPSGTPVTPGASGTPATPNTTPSGSGTPSRPATPGTSASSSASAKSSTTPSKPAPPPPPAACNPKDLRPTLTGPRDVKVGTPVTFEAGVINGGTAACTFTIDPKTYEFRIYSGTDRIWTTKDCAAWTPKVSTVLAPEKAVTWKILWTVQRSKDCAVTKDVLRPGTYAANSLLTGADPAQLVMQLRS